jgi:hypothetical protein
VTLPGPVVCTGNEVRAGGASGEELCCAGPGSQALSAPGLPSSTTKEAKVRTGKISLLVRSLLLGTLDCLRCYADRHELQVIYLGTHHSSNSLAHSRSCGLSSILSN